MAPRFGSIKFNFLRAVEFFQDMNDEDMEVAAPPSDEDHHKEYELAVKLNEHLIHLIEEGFFDDCEARSETEDDEQDEEEEDRDEEEPSEEEEEVETEGSDLSPAGSEGFDYDENNSSDERRSQGSSFSDRFKRYIKKIIPQRRRS